MKLKPRTSTLQFLVTPIAAMVRDQEITFDRMCVHVIRNRTNALFLRGESVIRLQRHAFKTVIGRLRDVAEGLEP